MELAYRTHLRYCPTDELEMLAPDGCDAADIDGASLGVTDGVVAVPALAAPSVGMLTFTKGGEDVASCILESVSAHYFPLETFLSDPVDDFSDMSDEQLWDARERAVEVFERNAGRSFVEHIAVETVVTDGFVELLHCDVSEILFPDSFSLVSDCQAEGPAGAQRIEYRWGCKSVPTAVAQAVYALASYYLRPDVTPSRATGEATEAGFLRFSLAGRDGATGLPEVDAIIEQFGRKRYAVL